MYLAPRIPEEQIAKYKALYESGIIVWHNNEKGRHGTIHGIKKEHVVQIHRMLLYYFGPKCAWQKKNADNTIDLEFVYQGNGKQKFPWYWCGSTVLFKEWQVREDTAGRYLDTFNLGDSVEFTYKGDNLKGIVINKRKNATVISGGRKFTVPPMELRKVT